MIIKSTEVKSGAIVHSKKQKNIADEAVGCFLAHSANYHINIQVNSDSIWYQFGPDVFNFFGATNYFDFNVTNILWRAWDPRGDDRFYVFFRRSAKGYCCWNFPDLSFHRIFS